eukprot:scaffold65977_cov23-Tisochrysis_lutea.AAC.1
MSPAPALTLSQPSISPALGNNHHLQKNHHHPTPLCINGVHAQQAHSHVPPQRQHAHPLHQVLGMSTGLAQANSTAAPLCAPPPPQ